MKYYILKFYLAIARFVSRVPKNFAQIIARTLVSQTTHNDEEFDKSIFSHLLFLRNRDAIRIYYANQNKILSQKYEGLHMLKKENKDKSDFGEKANFVHSLHLVNDPFRMDDFSLDEVETVQSEWEIHDLNEIPDVENYRSAIGRVPKRKILIAE